ncbi:MAG: hypothetical protein QM727_06065 [Niabella sp.]
MMRKPSLLVALMAICCLANAQSTYQQSIGVRLNPPSIYEAFAGSFKTFLGVHPALEFNLGVGGDTYYYSSADYRTTTLSVSATYQHHFDIKSVKGLKWYVGGGSTVFHSSSGHKPFKGTSLGFYPTGGADYKFAKIPLNVSADWRPTFLVAKTKQYSNFYADGIGASARFTF